MYAAEADNAEIQMPGYAAAAVSDALRERPLVGPLLHSRRTAERQAG
jgi:hypothetical protein